MPTFLLQLVTFTFAYYIQTRQNWITLLLNTINASVECTLSGGSIIITYIHLICSACHYKK